MRNTVNTVNQFVKEHVYPSYKVMCEAILAQCVKNDEFFDILSEYGQVNHEWCKKIYEGITNDDTCTLYGKKIADRGGFSACLLYTSPSPRDRG